MSRKYRNVEEFRLNLEAHDACGSPGKARTFQGKSAGMQYFDFT
jgi:hypothetical protein